MTTAAIASFLQDSADSIAETYNYITQETNSDFVDLVKPSKPSTSVPTKQLEAGYFVDPLDDKRPLNDQKHHSAPLVLKELEGKEIKSKEDGTTPGGISYGGGGSSTSFSAGGAAGGAQGFASQAVQQGTQAAANFFSSLGSTVQDILDRDGHVEHVDGTKFPTKEEMDKYEEEQNASALSIEDFTNNSSSSSSSLAGLRNDDSPNGSDEDLAKLKMTRNPLKMQALQMQEKDILKENHNSTSVGGPPPSSQQGTTTAAGGAAAGGGGPAGTTTAVLVVSGDKQDPRKKEEDKVDHSEEEDDDSSTDHDLKPHANWNRNSKFEDLQLTSTTKKRASQIPNARVTYDIGLTHFHKEDEDHPFRRESRTNQIQRLKTQFQQRKKLLKAKLDSVNWIKGGTGTAVAAARTRTGAVEIENAGTSNSKTEGGAGAAGAQQKEPAVAPSGNVVKEPGTGPQFFEDVQVVEEEGAGVEDAKQQAQPASSSPTATATQPAAANTDVVPANSTTANDHPENSRAMRASNGTEDRKEVLPENSTILPPRPTAESPAPAAVLEKLPHPEEQDKNNASQSEQESIPDYAMANNVQVVENSKKRVVTSLGEGMSPVGTKPSSTTTNFPGPLVSNPAATETTSAGAAETSTTKMQAAPEQATAGAAAESTTTDDAAAASRTGGGSVSFGGGDSRPGGGSVSFGGGD
ncbi:unnamed protein product [Amoebophrya sp. A120]|nr:unnamed protein product [Amoebophrya sp. A120]|eukprot:GSA120T00013895001.1